LRTPLNAMLGYSDLWLMDIPVALPEPMKGQVERVRISARHLLELIEEILTFSRIEAARETVEVETAALHELVQSAAAVVEPLALAKGLRFELALPDTDTILETDPRKVRQILINLMSNAVKFTAEGAVRLDVREEGADVVFVVTDTGVGIATADLECVFEPFWQARQSTPDRPAGTGLGLAVSRRLARLMGGDVSARSREGHGTTFTVTLPAHTPVPPTD
jgi:signal transduction histidine kinase